MMRMLAFLLFPSLVGLGVVAPVLVPVVFGPKWAAAVMFARPAFEMLLPVSPALLAALVLTGAAVYGTLVFTMERPYVAGLWRIAFGGPAEDAA